METCVIDIMFITHASDAESDLDFMVKCHILLIFTIVVFNKYQNCDRQDHIVTQNLI